MVFSLFQITFDWTDLRDALTCVAEKMKTRSPMLGTNALSVVPPRLGWLSLGQQGPHEQKTLPVLRQGGEASLTRFGYG
jgi:hypothetical protein